MSKVENGEQLRVPSITPSAAGYDRMRVDIECLISKFVFRGSVIMAGCM